MTRSINVVYDHQVFSWQQYGGVSRYFYELAARVGRSSGFSARIIAPLHVNRYLGAGGVAVRGLKVPVLPYTLQLRGAANRYLSAALVRSAKPDLLHETFYEHTRLPKHKCPTVVTVHDMIHEKFKAKFEAHNRTSAAKRLAVEHADRIICVSDCTRRDLIDLFGTDPKKIETIHLGFSLQTDAGAVPVLPAHRPYLLYVGQRQGHKNFSVLLDAYSNSSRLRAEFDLVAFGGGRLSAEETTEIHVKAGGDAKHVHHWSGDDTMLGHVYRHAVALVYPSLYEGFGIPPLEAMSFGCPVVCSDASSIPEIVGDAGAYFDPTRAEAVRHAIETLVESSELQARLIARGHDRVQAFSYDRCAARTMAVYRALAA